MAVMMGKLYASLRAADVAEDKAREACATTISMAGRRRLA